jgi:hypothetical protein
MRQSDEENGATAVIWMWIELDREHDHIGTQISPETHHDRSLERHHSFRTVPTSSIPSKPYTTISSSGAVPFPVLSDAAVHVREEPRVIPQRPI